MSAAELQALRALEAKQQAEDAQQQETETEEEPVAESEELQASDSEDGDNGDDNGVDDEDDNEDDNGDDDEGDNEEGDNGDDYGDEEEEEEEGGEAVGLGDAMSKILQQSVGADAAPILAKRTTARMREIQSSKSETKSARLSAAERRLKEQKDMIIPDHSTQAKDRQLRAIATKGVVALFNAIEKHQHQSGAKDEKNTKKVKEMSKDNFLGLLKSQKAAVEKPPAPATKSSWAVVQDDFMMDAKLKDWDATHGTEVGRVRKQDEEDAEDAEAAAWSQVGAAMDSDDDDKSAGAAKKRRAASGSSKNAKKSKRS